MKSTPSKSAAFKFVILLGIVSLCADATYEGARSINGQFLGSLGATGTVVGLVAGFGELIAYGLRLLIGFLSDRTRQYWRITTIGYIINTLVVPLLALAGNLPVAAGLMMAERTGKAIRTPPRDVLLSHAVTQVGTGFGFGVHEALDQIGAVSGPLMVAVVLSLQNDYSAGYAALMIPAVIGLIVLLTLQKVYPNPREFELANRPILKAEKFPKAFWLYLGSVVLIAAGYADFPLIAYHFQQVNLSDTNSIPLLYALAMGVDAIAAILFGRLFDRIGLLSLAIAAFLASVFAPLVFLGTPQLAIVGIILWGIGMGAQESIMKAGITRIVSADQRGSAFGVFATGYGLAWFLGSVLMGILYDRSLLVLVIFSVIIQLLALPLLLGIHRQMNTSNPQ